MAGFDHSAPPPAEPRDAACERHNARLGLWLFGVYAPLFVGFVGVNALSPAVMGADAPFGLNVATAWGFLLIVSAFLLGLVYTAFCRNPKPENR